MTDLVKQARELGGFSPEAELCSLMADEIERLRAALKAFSCDCEENECAQWGEDGPRFDCVFRRYRGLVEKE